MAKFKAFKPQAMERIARTMGYSGDMGNFNQYLDSNVSLKQRMKQLEDSAMEMSKNGTIKQSQKQSQNTVGAFVPPPTQTFDPVKMQQGGVIRLQEGGIAKPPVDNPIYTPKKFKDLNKYVTTPGFPSDGSQGNLGNVYADGTPVSKIVTTMPVPPISEGNLTLPPIPAGGQAQPLPQQYIPQAQYEQGQSIQELMAKQAQAPALPTGATVVPQGTLQEQGQMINPAQGQLTGAIQTPIAQATTSLAEGPVTTQAASIAPITTEEKIKELQANAQQGASVPVIDAQTSNEASISNLNAAQGTSIKMENPVQRQVQEGELVSPVANAQTASQFTEKIEAATATPSEQATVQGQLTGMMQQFEGGKTPAWAAGAIRAANHAMIQRGVGASSMAGQAIVQAAMESALPIASADAQVQAQFESQNLSNRQQRAVLAAQQRATFMGQEFDQAFQARVQNSARIGDIANMNFTAEQQVALENSRNANTVNLNNLGNRQAMVLAEASALSNMDMSNLNNRQQAAVMNAQNFMQMDMTNLSNAQQTELFNTQARQQSLFTDQAAMNASAQFNASSQNQVDQFFAGMQSQVGQFNSAQANAQSQYNAGQANTVERFNAELNNQRDQFNAQNRLVIDQSNAQWRRQLATADTTAINRSNEMNAQSLLGLSNQSYNNLWQYYGDAMEWAWTSAENERSRVVNMAIEQLRSDADANIQGMKNDYASSAGFGTLIGSFLTAGQDSVISNIFGFG